MRKLGRILGGVGRKSFFEKEIKNLKKSNFCFRLPAFFVENDGYFAYFNRKKKHKS